MPLSSGLTRAVGAVASLTLALAAVACAAPASVPGAENPSSAQPSASPTVATPSASNSGTDGPLSPSAPAAASVEPPAPAPPTPLELCGKMCDHMGQGCGHSAVTSCRVNCKQYKSLAAGCDAEARAALECAGAAVDLQCANIAPVSCNSMFLRLAACARGEKLEVKQEKSVLPQGWQRFVAKTAGFAALMPPGVVEKSEAGEPIFSVEEGAVTYSVRVRKAPEQKPTQKILLKVALDLLGVRCSKKLRLHGMIEHDQRVAIRFDSQCADGVEWRGQLVVAHGKLCVLALTGPKGFVAEHDAFFSSFTLY